MGHRDGELALLRACPRGCQLLLPALASVPSLPLRPRVSSNPAQDRFTDSTPYGNREFTNLVFTFDPDAPRRIVLAAHFDSKFFPTAPNNEVRLPSGPPVAALCACAC